MIGPADTNKEIRGVIPGFCIDRSDMIKVKRTEKDMGFIWEWSNNLINVIFENRFYTILASVFLTQTIVHIFLFSSIRIVGCLGNYVFNEKIVEKVAIIAAIITIAIFIKYVIWAFLFELFYYFYFLRFIVWLTTNEDICKKDGGSGISTDFENNRLG